jgi:DNA repair photolyase
MKEYSPIISFSKNSRGVYSIDPSIGCHSGATKNKRGCYSDCYAYRIAKIYGYDFSKTVFRDFESNKHLAKIKRQIRKINMPFIRMGTMGDPSENWDHTLYICKSLQTEQQLELFPQERKEIVIITKHWNNLSDKQLLELKQCKICINTSISVLDDDFVFEFTGGVRLLIPRTKKTSEAIIDGELKDARKALSDFVEKFVVEEANDVTKH